MSVETEESGGLGPSRANSHNNKENDTKWFKSPDGVDLDGSNELEIKDVLQNDISAHDKRLRGRIEPESPFIPVNRIDKNWADAPGLDSTPRVKDVVEHFKNLFEDLANTEISEWFSDLSSSEGHAMARMVNLLARKYKLSSDQDFLAELKEKFKYQNYSAQDFTELLFGHETETISTYQEMIKSFLSYIKTMDNLVVLIGKFQGEESYAFEATHRWKKEYAQKMAAKLYDLKGSRFSDMPQAMVTLTGYQDGELTPEDWDKDRERSWFELNEDLNEGRKLLFKNLRQIARREISEDAKVHYIWVKEPHPSSGYPHIHVLFFGPMAKWLRKSKNQERIENLWNNKWDIGNEHGLDVECSLPGRNEENQIEDIVNYFMEYMFDNFGEIQSEFTEKVITDMPYEILLYNACMWASGGRTWGASSEVSSVMKRDKDDKQSEGFWIQGGGKYSQNTERWDFSNVVYETGDPEIIETFNRRQVFRQIIVERHGGPPGVEAFLRKNG